MESESICKRALFLLNDICIIEQMKDKSQELIEIHKKNFEKGDRLFKEYALKDGWNLDNLIKIY